MVVIGWVACLCVMIYVTAVLIFIGWTVPKIRSTHMREVLQFISFLLIDVGLWLLLFTNSPFMVVMR